MVADGLLVAREGVLRVHQVCRRFGWVDQARRGLWSVLLFKALMRRLARPNILRTWYYCKYHHDYSSSKSVQTGILVWYRKITHVHCTETARSLLAELLDG